MTGDEQLLAAALKQARIGYQEGGVPVGAVLAVDSEVLGAGRNRRVQEGSVIRHGETDCLEDAGRRSPRTYTQSTLYTTLSPCFMCSGAILLYNIPRLVVGENRTFLGAEDLLRAEGVHVDVLDSADCRDLMRRFIEERPEVWNEDIGESG